MRNAASMIRKVHAGLYKLVNAEIISRSVLTGILVMLLSYTGSAQTVSPVTVTGFNADVIANGPVFAGSVTADVDSGNYYFLNQSFTAFGTPVNYLPNSGFITSAVSSLVTFQMADASVNNSLRLDTIGGSGTLTLTSPRTAGVVYLLVTSGGSNATINATLNFSDGSTQTISGLNVPDWYYGAGFAIQGIGRVNGNGQVLDNGGGASNPRIYQLALAVSGANYTKPISSLTFTRTSSRGITHLMAVSMMNACVAPVTQPTALVLNTASSSQITGSFTAASPAADAYIVVRYPAGATPVAPVHGTTYNVGTALGTGVVVQTGATTTFTASGLIGGTAYDFYVYGYNNTNCIGPVYNTTTPLTGARSTNTCTGPSGVIPVGPTGTYPTLTAALAALSGGVSGPVTLELQSTYTSTGETFPIVIASNACFNASRTLTIRPEAGANGLVITGSNPGPSIDLNGAKYVTIDGRPGGAGSAIAVTAAGNLNTTNLNIINTSATGAAIRLDNGASNNTIKYCDLQGMNAIGGSQPVTMAGVVYFGNNGVNGNDNNTIDHCNVHSSGTGASMPSIGVYALGASNTGANGNFNDNDTISNCNIYDYFLVNNNSAGIELTQGVSGWVISGNSFFQTAARTYTTAGFNRAIWISSNRNAGSVGNGFIITGNHIGGSEPACGGTPYTLSALANYFDGIRLEVADGLPVAPSSVQGNTITNIAITSTITTANDVFHGIAVTGSNGNVNIGTVTGNVVGSATGKGAITIAAGSGSHTIPYFISNGSGANSVINLKQNVAGGITLSNAGNNFSGIYDNQPGTVNIDGNLIGSLTTANSIDAVSTTTTRIFVRGINIPSGAGTFAITNNTIANLTNNSTSTLNGCQTAGINIGSTSSIVSTVSGNTVRNLYSASGYAFGSSSSAVLGIYMGSTTASAVTVSGNTVHSLVSGAPTAGVYLEGIFFRGNNSAAITNTISKNTVHSFDVTTANANVNIRGIEVNQGKADIYNNMVRLGIRPDGASLTNPVRIDGIMKGSGLNSSIFYNSVYIGGTGVGTAAGNTSAIRKEIVTGSDDVRNNIFINDRSNSTTGGVHNAIWVNGLAGFTFEHNIYGYGGTGGNFVSTNSAGVVFATVYTSGWNIGGDTTSQATDPLFVDAMGPAATVDLHITTSMLSPANGAAVPVTLVTEDMEGEARDLLTPDVGADEFTQLNGIDIQAVSIGSPIAGKGCYGKEAVKIKIRNNSSAAIDFAADPVTLTVKVTGAATATIGTVLNTGTLAGGATVDVELNGATDSVDMSAAGTYIFDAKTTVAGDMKVSNDAMSTVTRTREALVSGTIDASQTSYCFNGAPVLTLTGGSGFSDIQWQASTDSSTYTNIANATTTPFTTPAATQTLYYRLAAACVSDTLYTPAVKVIINSPAVTGATPGSRCNAGMVNLQATGSAGSTLYWYADATSTTPVGVGASYTTPSITGTTTYYVMAAAGSCSTARMPVDAIVNDRIAIATQPQSQGVCMGSAVVFNIGVTGSALTYQWRKNGVNIPNANNDTYTIANAVAADAGQYDVVITNPCGIIVSGVAALSVQSSNDWVGQVSSDWNTAANWCGGVPAPTTNVTINAGTPYSPVISGAASANTVTIGTGASLKIDANGTLNLYGNFVNNGTLDANAGTVAFRGATGQTVAAMQVANVIMDGAGGVTLNGNMTISNTLTLNNGNITPGSFDIHLQNAATGSVASHIVTNGNGSAIATNVTNTITVPVGHSPGHYNPVTIGNGQGMTYTVRVKEGLIAKVIDDNKAINRTWNVTTTGIPAAPVSITLQYADADANPGCVPAAVMDAGVYNGATWALVSPANGVTPAGTSAARQVALSTTQLGNMVITNQGMLKAAVYEFKVQLLPTLVTGSSARLRISSQRTMKINWTVIDATGKLTQKFTTSLIAGVNDVSVNLAGLASGVYTLHGIGDDGNKETIRFMIRH